MRDSLYCKLYEQTPNLLVDEYFHMIIHSMLIFVFAFESHHLFCYSIFVMLYISIMHRKQFPNWNFCNIIGDERSFDIVFNISINESVSDKSYLDNIRFIDDDSMYLA